MGDEDLPLFDYVERKKDREQGTYSGPPKNRPNPTGTLIVDVCGADRTLIGAVENGLFEAPMGGLYPHLDLEELLAFSAAQWTARDRELSYVQRLISGTMYDFFSEMMGRGIPWVRSRQDMSNPQKKDLYARLNPYQGRGLRERLRRVPKEEGKKLRTALNTETRKHCFEREYDRVKKSRDGDNWGLRVMDFQQNAYPPSKRNGPEQFQRQWDTMIRSFGREIARKVRNYPNHYYPIS